MKTFVGIFIVGLCLAGNSFATEEILPAMKYIKVTLSNYTTHFCSSEYIQNGCMISTSDKYVMMYNVPSLKDEYVNYRWPIVRVREIEYK